jgi:hypothetical protein
MERKLDDEFGTLGPIALDAVPDADAAPKPVYDGPREHQPYPGKADITTAPLPLEKG